MGLDLGTLSVKVDVNDRGVDAKLNRVKRSLDDVDKAAQKASRSKLDVTPKGADSVAKTSRSIDQLGDRINAARAAADKFKVNSNASAEFDKAVQAAKRAQAATENAGRAGERLRVSSQPKQELDSAASSASKLGKVMGSLGDIAPMVGFGAAAGGIAAGLQKTLTIGNDFTNTLNTMNAVSGATEGQMKQISDAARQLGNDISLPNTSASDAAAAMTELAKGGFSVEQSMSAAKGTLQLAAAAQIDAAQAATIQSQALQSFGLNADYAGKMSDVLANAANASSAEITGIAQGLQQSGAVAHQFGLSVEDTAAALGMFANAGIQGSDAGTLLKTALLAITDQGGPAQAAIKELGLNVYDAQGKFVGMHSLMSQLNDASKRMTDEQYQAATATLFGSDAMRLAGIAAKQGSSGFDKMREAVDRQGAAAEVAAAKTKGLPGAIAQVQNAGEELALGLYERFQGPLTGALTTTASGITKIGNAMEAVPGPVFAGALALLASRFLDLNGKMNAGGGALMRFGQQMRVQQALAAQTGRQIGTIGAAMATLNARIPTIGRMSAAFQSASAPLLTLGHNTRMAASSTSGLARVLGTAQSSMQTFGGIARGVAGGGMSLLKTGASGLIGVLGGPWGIAITAATTALGFLAQKHQEAAQKEAEHQAKQDELRGTLDQTTGSITNQTNELQRQRAEKDGLLKTATDLGIASGTVVQAMNGERSAINQVNAAVEAQGTKILQNSEYWREHGAKFQAAGITQQQVLDAMRGNLDKSSEAGRRFRDVSKQIADESGGEHTMHEQWRKARDEINGATDAANKLKEGVHGAAAESDAASEAAKRMAREGIVGGQQLADVFAKIGNDVVAIPDEKTIQVKSLAPNVAADLEKLGAKIERLPDGKVNIQFPNGMSVMGMLDQIGAKAKGMPDGRVDLSDNTPEVKNRLVQLGIAVRDPKTGNVMMKDNIADVVRKQQQLGLIVKSPLNGHLFVRDNVGQARASLQALKIQTQLLPPGHVRVIDNAPEVVGKLNALGVKTVTLPDGRVIIADNTPETQAHLDAVGAKTSALPPGMIQISDTSAENIRRLEALGVKTQRLPDGRVVITENADAVRNKITTTLSAENTNTESSHTISIIRRIKDIFERANGGIDAPVKAFADGTDHNVAKAVARRAAGGPEPSHNAHIASGGSYRVFAEAETGGEAYIPLANSKRPRSERILNEVARRFGYQLVNQQGQIQQFANGALLPGSAVKKKLKFMDGTPYIFGGWSPAGVDCSGAVALAVNVSEGLKPFDSRTATGTEAAWLTAKGYRRGRGHQGDYRVGFYNGGPGGGHTAMQLDDGTFIESGGNTGGGFTIGRSAGPLNGRGFTDWFFKPGAMPVGDAGLDFLDGLSGAPGARKARGFNTPANVDSSVMSTDSGAGGTATKTINGGAGTLIKDGSFLELVAAMHSKLTGTKYADDITSWGQVAGFHTKVEKPENDKASKQDEKEQASATKKIESAKDKLEKAKAATPALQERLRIAKLRRAEMDKRKNKPAGSEIAQADLQIREAQRRVDENRRQIRELEAEVKKLEAALNDIGDINPLEGLDKNLPPAQTSGNKYADAIIREGRRRGITDKGIQIALATALVESGLRMYANPADPGSMKFPHDAVGHDHDSVGLFQQRNNGAWGTVADRMSPSKSAGMFYDRLDDANYNEGDPGAHAQRVQGSAFPGRYAQRMDEAARILARYGGKPGKVRAMANGGILGHARQAQIQDGSSAVLWAEAGPEAYIPLSRDKRARALDVWAETGKRLGIDAMGMVNLIASGLPGLVEGKLNFETGGSVNLDQLGLNMDAAAYRGGYAGAGAARQAVGAVFNGPVQINDPRQFLQAQLNNGTNQLRMAMRSVGM